MNYEKQRCLNKIRRYGKEGFEGKDIFCFMEEELCDYCSMELFSCKCPNKCNEDGDYCYECIEEHIDLFLDGKLENK